MSWKGGSKGTEHNPALALRHLPWLRCFLGALQWHRSCEDRSAVCRWSTASGVVPSQRAPRRLTIACWKSWSTNKSLLYHSTPFSFSLFVSGWMRMLWAGLTVLGTTTRYQFALLAMARLEIGRDNARMICMLVSRASINPVLQWHYVHICSQWRGRRGKTYSVSSQSRLIWPSAKSWRVYEIMCQFSARVAFN